MLRRTSASQACGSTPLSFAVAINVYNRCTPLAGVVGQADAAANLLSTPRFWHTVLYPELYRAECPFIRDTRRAAVVCHASERREAMTMPGFSAETSLYRREIQYGGMRASVQASSVMLQQLPHLFCRPTDCPCQKAACMRGGGIVVPSRQPPCFFTCKRR